VKQLLRKIKVWLKLQWRKHTDYVSDNSFIRLTTALGYHWSYTGIKYVPHTHFVIGLTFYDNTGFIEFTGLTRQKALLSAKTYLIRGRP